jgi:CRISP-associated protein Cas1
MRKLLNTLYVSTEGAWLRKEGETIVVEVDGEKKAQLPLHHLQSIVCIGRVLISPPLMGHCTERGMSISYLGPYGKFLARVEGPISGNVLLRREQYRRTDNPEACSKIVRYFLIGKTHNQRNVLRRALRDHSEKMSAEASKALDIAQRRLTHIAENLFHENRVDGLRGLEGEAAQVYFSIFNHLIRANTDFFVFSGRNRRPPRDAINAILSLVYTLLTHDCRSALETVGLDPAVGFLHRDRPGRPSLALDLAEEFRSALADRLALSLINRKQLNSKDFKTLENGAVILTDDARKTLLKAYQERKQEKLRHPYLEEECELGLVPLLQAQLLARHLRGDMDGYPPFLWK